MTNLQAIQKVGQSVWIDYIRRSFLDNGDLQTLIEKGVSGVTSNPAIFEKAIAQSDDYDVDIRNSAGSETNPAAVFEKLAIADIRRAADMLRPLYDSTDGGDGFVSLEVSPDLAHDTARTIADAKRLNKQVNRPNLMIKIPATKEGIPAIEEALTAGININVTLIFSQKQYENTVKAYLSALERRLEKGAEIHRLASVASFFVSRVDTAVDRELEDLHRSDLKGCAAVDNAKLAYARFKELFSGERWQRLAHAGARVQRPLWASTGTKNPAYPDTLYVDRLIGDHTVNTMPPATLEAVLDHGMTEPSVECDLEGACARMEMLKQAGVNMEAITAKLLDDGVEAFAKAYAGLLKSVAEKTASLT